MSYREQLADFLKVVSSTGELLSYEKNVPICYVPLEIIEQFFGLFHPKSQEFVGEFSRDELVDIAILSGYIHIVLKDVQASGRPPLATVLKRERWRDMMSNAKSLLCAISSLQKR